MFEAKLAKEKCQLRLYILTSIHESKIGKFLNRMKPVYFNAVLKQIKDYVLCVDTHDQ